MDPLWLGEMTELPTLINFDSGYQVTREHYAWLNTHYPPDIRYQSAIVKVRPRPRAP